MNSPNVTITIVSSLHETEDRILGLIILIDNRIAAFTSEPSIRIYSPNNNYHCDSIIHTKNTIIDMCQIDDGTFVFCSAGPDITIGNHKIERAHSNSIMQVLSLPYNQFASCSLDHTIKVWKGEPPYINTPIVTLVGHKDWISSIAHIKERQLLLSV